MKKYYWMLAKGVLAVIIAMGLLSPLSVYALEEAPEGEAVSETEASYAPEEELLADEVSAEMEMPMVPISDGRMVSSIIPDNMIPALFHKVNLTFENQAVEGVAFENGNIVLLYVKDTNGNSQYMRLEDDGTLSYFRMIPGPGESYIMVLEPDDSIEAPEGFEKAVLDWNGQSLSAFVDVKAVSNQEALEGVGANPAEFFMVYALSSQGNEGFYLYDQSEKTYQRYLNTANSSVGNSSLKLSKVYLIVLIVMSVLLIGLIVTVIILAVKLKEYSSYEYIDEEEYNSLNDNETVENEASVNSREAQSETKTESKTQPKTESKAEAKKETVKEVKKTAKRRNVLETCEIADLDDILNDPNLTSNLPTALQIERSIAKKEEQSDKGPKKEEIKKEAPKKTEAGRPKDADFENMQVTVDSFSAGMPAMVDTNLIAEDVDGSDSKSKKSSGRITGEMEFALDQYSEESYQRDEYYYNEEDFSDEDDYYSMTRRERKALEKQRRKEEKEALKDQKYLEKERKKAQKRKDKGYAEPTAMDWSSFQESITLDKDDRKPRGNNAANLPAYMTEEDKRKKEEEKKANDAADAVIKAARGEDYNKDLEKSEDDYKEYIRNSKNYYEELREEDEKNSLKESSKESTVNAVKETPKKPEYSLDIDDDFEFEFLNIKRSK